MKEKTVNKKSNNAKRSHKGLRVFLWILLGLAGLAIILVAFFFLYGLNFTEPAIKDVWKAGFEEHTFVTNGTMLNYAEGPDNGLPLLLIHGQLGLWQSYQLVLPELSKSFHVYAIDCHGHGKSKKFHDTYTIQMMGKDFEAFIETVIGEPAVVSGNSSGGLLALWLAANSPDNVISIVMEDPPLFSSEYPRIKNIFTWDTLETAHNFLQQTAEDDFLNYYILNSKLMSLFGKGKEGIYNWIQFYRKKRPDNFVEVFFLPLSIRGMFIGLSFYDPYFGDSFYDGSWQKDFIHEEALSQVGCPSVLIHSNWYYDDNNILMGAMDSDDAKRAESLMSDCKLLRVDSGHTVHIEDPEIFINILLDHQKDIRDSIKEVSIRPISR